MIGAVLVLVALPLPLIAQEARGGLAAEGSDPAASAHTHLYVATTGERLSKNLPEWRETTLQLKSSLGPGHAWVVGLGRSSRFNLEDVQVSGLYTRRFTPSLAATFEANASPTHRVLPRNALGAKAHYEFQRAWLAHAGVRSTSYDAVRANQLQLGVERYVGPFSASASWNPTHAFGRVSHAAEVRGTYFYATESSLGVLLAHGRELAVVGTAVTLTDVRAAALIGKHQLNERWALTYAASHTKQGELYTRRGINVGFQYAL